MKERLEAYKAKTGKTWQQVADEIGCAVGYLYEIRRGDKPMQSKLFKNRMSDLEKGE